MHPLNPRRRYPLGRIERNLSKIKSHPLIQSLSPFWDLSQSGRSPGPRRGGGKGVRCPGERIRLRVDRGLHPLNPRRRYHVGRVDLRSPVAVSIAVLGFVTERTQSGSPEGGRGERRAAAGSVIRLSADRGLHPLNPRRRYHVGRVDLRSPVAVSIAVLGFVTTIGAGGALPRGVSENPGI